MEMHGFYARLREKREDDTLLQDCIETVINKLEAGSTSVERPGMLLGKIQSGKTRGFLGVITRAFDRGYEIALVFTKGTKTLAKQTVQRISHDFQDFIDDEELMVFDIMQMPDRLTQSELKRKLVIVAKKETNNLTRVIDLVQKIYPQLAKRKILIVDDEADMASVRFVKKKGDPAIKQGAIAQQLDTLRGILPKVAFLQVTATPYALYLQPKDYVQPGSDDFLFRPKHPAFTALLPIHGGYVGGDDYFGDFDVDDLRHYLHQEVPEDELNALRGTDARAIRHDRIWTSKNIVCLRHAVMTFLLAVVIRRWQQKMQEQRPKKYAMIMHNDTQKLAHEWQYLQVEKLRVEFEKAAPIDKIEFRKLFDDAYDDLVPSVKAHGGKMLSRDQAYAAVKTLVTDGEIIVQRVNSDVQLDPLLDPNTAELLMRTQANIFIGGSILDRGITIPNLIAFYYGRSPKTMQADTVLQHSRMYGNRDRQDLAVTRFYTSKAVRSRLERIHQLETALREAFESGVNDGAVVFIQSDAAKGVVPCAPSKVSASELVTAKPKSFYLPTEFDTLTNKAFKDSMKYLDAELKPYLGRPGQLHEITLTQAEQMLNAARKTMSISSDIGFSWEAMLGLIRYYCKAAKSERVQLLVEIDRKIDRKASGDKSGRSIVGTATRNRVLDTDYVLPTIIFLQQEGSKKLHWAADAQFWWPILVTPAVDTTCVFANVPST